ncbi:N/A [soil metagenome]
MTQLQRHLPFKSLNNKRRFLLPLEQINPTIRIAHRQVGPLDIPERIIFDSEFVLIVAGRGTLTTSDGPVPFKPGTLIFIRPFWPHAFNTGGKRCEHLAVHFDFRANLPPKSKDLGNRSPYEIHLAGNAQIPKLHACLQTDAIYVAFVSLISAAHRGGPVAMVQQRSELMRILALLLSLTPPVAADADGDARTVTRIDRAIRHIAANIAEPPTAAELAEIAGLSPSHFTRVFREHTGYTPMDYLRHERIKTARVLLAGVDLSIKEIAARCGFEDQYHFSKTFRQIDGLSPSDYRDAALAGRIGR